MDTIKLVFILLIAFQIKHFLADYPLQNKYMLGKFKGGTDWILPLVAHSFVHAVLTLWICFCFSSDSVLSLKLALLDFCVHFVQDRLKASPNLLGRFKIESPYFWWALGQDQMTHHLTHYCIIYFLIT